MSQRILITGGCGMLAMDLAAYYREKDCNVFAPSRKELDVLKTSQIFNIVSEFRPNLIFHTAVYHVEPSEENPEIAFNVNALSTQKLAKAAQKINATFIYISTCGLFGDDIKPYSEDDNVVLKTEYAKSKYEGENLAVRECDRLFVVRPGWLFGGAFTHKRNFVYQRYLEAKDKNVLQSANDKYGSPTYTIDLIRKMDELINSRYYGTYHLANEGSATRADYVEKIVKTFDLSTNIERVDSSNFPRKADVPNCEILKNLNSERLSFSKMPHWEESIERFIHEIRKDISL